MQLTSEKSKNETNKFNTDLIPEFSLNQDKGFKKVSTSHFSQQRLLQVCYETDSKVTQNKTRVFNALL